MAGASRNHDHICANIIASLHTQLRGKDCEVFTSDMRVKLSKIEMFIYPDVKVVCGDAILTDEDKPDTLTNPTVIFEVLSPSTEDYDRGKKFESYRTLDSLKEYLLISQDKIHIEHFVRQSQKEWQFIDITQSDDSITLPKLACTLQVKDFYERVEFEAESNLDEASKD